MARSVFVFILSPVWFIQFMWSTKILWNQLWKIKNYYGLIAVPFSNYIPVNFVSPVQVIRKHLSKILEAQLIEANSNSSPILNWIRPSSRWRCSRILFWHIFHQNSQLVTGVKRWALSGQQCPHFEFSNPVSKSIIYMKFHGNLTNLLCSFQLCALCMLVSFFRKRIWFVSILNFLLFWRFKI